MTKKGYIYSDQGALFGAPNVIGFGSGEWHVKEIDRNLANEIIVKNHYSGKFYNATYIHLGVFIGGELLGVLQYGYAMNPASCSSVVAETEIDEYLELNRMWLDDKAPRNSESMAISYSFKYIKGRYPKIKWVQSFADERCGGFGIVYQACSFGFYGEHKSLFWTLDGEVFHNSLMTRNPKLSKSAKKLQENKERATSEELRQFRYIRFINKRYKDKCLLEEKPYLKYYNGD
ncbi:MAG: hypothetical protein GY787_29980 [Alteromonadales bacterium]|nr:hypothetical protein [Alteromonadales bacterium]